MIRAVIHYLAVSLRCGSPSLKRIHRMGKLDLCMDPVSDGHAIGIGYQMMIHCPAALVTGQMTIHLCKRKKKIHFSTFLL